MRQDETVDEVLRLRTELGRAYRALRGFYSFAAKAEVPNKTMMAYHALTIGASIRFVNYGSLDGADYFVGKPVDVLHDVFK